jgi:long-chain fatty acid transport protein
MAPAPLWAQGFGVYEHGTCTMGRSGTAAAAPCNDGSAIFFNPAGLGGITGTRASVGGTLILPSGGFTRDFTGVTTNAPSQTYLVPNFFLAHRLTENTGVGIGVFAPYGLGTKWPSDQSFEGRFLGYNTSLKSIYVQPTIGYALSDRLKVGLGVAYIHGTVELHQRADLSTQFASPGVTFAALGVPAYTDFADAGLEASGNGWAINFGAILKLSDQLSIGGHWLTRSTIEYEGDVVFEPVPTGLVLAAGNPLGAPAGTSVDNLVAAQFAPGAPLSDGAATTEITMPPQGSIGLAWKPIQRWTFLADYQLVVWGWFSSLTLNFANATTPDIVLNEGYRDTHGFRFGTEYEYSPKLTFRGGYLFHTAAAPTQTVTPLLPEGARNEVTLGLGVNLNEKLHADFGYQYILQNDRRGRVNEITIGNTGLYTFSAHLLGASLVYTF